LCNMLIYIDIKTETKYMLSDYQKETNFAAVRTLSCVSQLSNR